MLCRVGPKNLDVLLEVLVTDKGQRFSAHLRHAIERLATESQKDLIIRYLEADPELSRVVMQHRWQEFAKDVLVKRLREKPWNLPFEWAYCVAMMQDPANHGLLREYVKVCSTPTLTFGYFTHVDPALDLSPTHAFLWERGLDRLERDQLAIALCADGFEPALGYPIEAMFSEPEPYTVAFHPGIERQFAQIMRHVDCDAETPEELRAWYKSNKGNLEFDPELQCWSFSG